MQNKRTSPVKGAKKKWGEGGRRKNISGEGALQEGWREKGGKKKKRARGHRKKKKAGQKPFHEPPIGGKVSEGFGQKKGGL